MAGGVFQMEGVYFQNLHRPATILPSSASVLPSRKRKRDPDSEKNCSDGFLDHQETALKEPRRGKRLTSIAPSPCLNEPRRGKTIKIHSPALSLNEPRRGKPLAKVLSEKPDRRVQTSRKGVQQKESLSSSKRNPKKILPFLIDAGAVSVGAKVHYRVSSRSHRPLTEGKITREGIECRCCSKVFTLTGFESHAGSTYHRPAANIFLEDGRSLVDCQAQLTAKRKTGSHSEIHRVTKTRSDDKKDSICSVCLFEGELVLCNRCPAAFHQSCINGFEGFSHRNWFCPSCICRFCKQPMSGEEDHLVLSCDYCQTEYHNGCGKKKGKWVNLNWFCSTPCQKIFLSIGKILGKPVPVGDKKLTWTLLKSMESPHLSNHLRDIEELKKNQHKLQLAVDVMHECFEESKDVFTGKDVAEEVIFNRGSELNRVNFRGFCVAVVENGDDMVSVATVRIHGDVAEIPLVATRFRYQRQGMCRVLMKELEKQLRGMGVKRLVLPALVEAVDTWVNYFGYSRMNEAEKLGVVDQRFLNFQGTVT